MTSDDAHKLLQDLNHGQRCLLHGLVKLCISSDRPASGETSGAGPSTSGYSVCVEKSRNIALKGVPLKEKINKLFHFGESSKRPKVEGKPDHNMEDFQPSLSYKRGGKGKGKGKLGGKISKYGKGSSKKKIREIRFRVVWVYPGTRSTPINRAEKAKEVWIRADASASEVEQRIREGLGWSPTQSFQYLYAQGKMPQGGEVGRHRE